MNGVLVCVQSGFNFLDDFLRNTFNKNTSLFHFKNACGSRGDFLFFLIKGAFKQTTPKSHRIYFNAIAGVALNRFRTS
jgi:hypothetical protein